MATRIKLAAVDAAALEGIENVVAVDPEVPGYYKQVWTLAAPAGLDQGPATLAEPPRTLEVEIDSEDPAQLEQLREVIEAVKGPLVEKLWDFDS